MERIGIYGGTYNPVHVGHYMAAVRAVDALGLDKLLMIPDRILPHKVLPEDSPTPEQRLEMLRLTVAGNPRIEASDLSMLREGPSYTYETVAQVRNLYPEAELFLLMGSDMFRTVCQWKEPEKIFSEVTIGVFYRGDRGEREQAELQKAKLEEMGTRVILLDNPVIDISSTQLRRMLVFRCASSFLSEKVSAYIYGHGLYGTGKDYHNLPVEELEQVVVRLLKPNRVAHVLGCRDTAVRLAKQWGANPVDAERAALLHDITKALDGELQLTLCREYGIILDNFCEKNPKTLHALTGSLVAQRIFGENQAVVDAICCHTTGKPGMNMLETILYVADYMEPSRNFPGVEELRHLTTVDMNQALKRGLEMTIALLQEQKQEISPESQQTLAYLETLQ